MFKQWLDEDARKDLDALIAMCQNPSSKEALRQLDQRCSQWVEHGRITPQLKQEIIPWVYKADDILTSLHK